MREATRILKAAGCETPRLDAELLLCAATGWDRGWLLAHPEVEVPSRQRKAFRQMVERRRRREPLAYILGRTEFYGLVLRIDNRALVPRPETELLVDRALEFLRSRGNAPPAVVADVGTGCGAIAIALACRAPEHVARIYAVDSSPSALELARLNARIYRVETKMRFVVGNLLEEVPEPLDLITANLPYVPAGEIPRLMPEIRWEPREALDGGLDGLEKIRGLLVQIPPRLRASGALLLEVGYGQARDVVTLVENALPGASVKVLKDYSGVERVVEVILAKP